MLNSKVIAISHNGEYFYNRVKSELETIYLGSHPSVSIFGSARLAEDTPEYRQAAEIAKRLGMPIITGGGPGIMEAANKGAVEGGQMSIGCTMTFLRYEEPNQYVDLTRPFEYFFTRKLALTVNSCAIVNMTGGFGTQDEAFEVLALKDRNPNINLPVIFVGKTFYKRWAELMQRDYDLGYLRRDPRQLFTVLDRTEDVVNFVKTNSNPRGRLDPVDTSKVMGVLKHAAARVSKVGTSRFVGLMGGSYQASGHHGYSDLAFATSQLLSKNNISILFRGNQVNANSINDGALVGRSSVEDTTTRSLAIDCNQDKGNGFVKGDHYIGGILRLFEQKVIMTRYAQLGHVFFPGGMGTKDYLFELMCLMQTSKTIRKPLILMGKDYWTPWYNYFKDVMLPKGVIKAEDLDMFLITDNPADALRQIQQFAKP